MYVSGNSSNGYGGYGGLASIWGFGEFGDEIDAKDLIPQKRTAISASKADAFLSRSGIGRKKENRDPEGNVFWTRVGPMVTKRPLYGGKQIEKVAPPTPYKESRVRVVRDMPVIDFPPVTSPLGEFGEGSKIPGIIGVVVVLGLLVWACRGYNSK